MEKEGKVKVIKTPVKAYDLDGHGWRVLDRYGDVLASELHEEEAKEIAAALNACAEIPVKALEQRVFARALDLLKNEPLKVPGEGPALAAIKAWHNEKRAIFDLCDFNDLSADDKP